jgi:hypothetical protein
MKQSLRKTLILFAAPLLMLCSCQTTSDGTSFVSEESLSSYPNLINHFSWSVNGPDYVFFTTNPSSGLANIAVGAKVTFTFTIHDGDTLSVFDINDVSHIKDLVNNQYVYTVSTDTLDVTICVTSPDTASTSSNA